MRRSVALWCMYCVAVGRCSAGHSSVTGKHSHTDDDGDDGGGGDGSRQQRIESAEPSVGHIAGAVVAILLIIAIILVIVSRLGDAKNHFIAFSSFSF